MVDLGHRNNSLYYTNYGGCRGRDHMVVGFITAISVYHH
jgi:hypothetical protein